MKIKFLLILLLATSLSAYAQIVIHNDMFTIHYSELYQQPTYVKYKVECLSGSFKRNGLKFFKVDSIKTSDDADYRKNDYDKGHMAPAANFSCDKEKIKRSFTYLNCALQQKDLNRGLWKSLEEKERSLAKRGKTEVTIIIHFEGNQKLPTGAQVPSGFTKIITQDKLKEKYFFPNIKPTKNSIEAYLIK